MAHPKHHVVAVALPSQGHLNSVMRFCKLLILHRPNVLVTFVDIDIIHTRIQEVMKREATDSPAPAPTGQPTAADVDTTSGRINRAHIPVQGIDFSNDFHLSFGSFIDALHSIDRPLHELIVRLNKSGPAVTCLLADIALTSHTQYAVDRLGIRRVILYPFSASRLLLQQYVIQEEQVSMTTVEKALATASTKKEVFCDKLPGLPTLFNVDLPHFKHVTDDSLFMWNLAMQALKTCSTQSHPIVVNTFHGLEASALMALSKLTHVPVYAVGPLIEPLHTDSHTSLWKEDDACISWLDQQPRSSVLYISFGSIAILSPAQFQELLEGLLSSGQRFLWSIRPDLVKDAPYASLCTLVLSKANGKGFVVDWAPQVTVLSHPSVGGFLTHCGWNSVIESITYGVPMLCWPYFADQPLNSRCIVDMWKLGLQFETKEENLQFIERNEVERVVRSLMKGMEGEEVRRNITTLKEVSNAAISQNSKLVANASLSQNGSYTRMFEQLLDP